MKRRTKEWIDNAENKGVSIIETSESNEGRLCCGLCNEPVQKGLFVDQDPASCITICVPCLRAWCAEIEAT